MIRTHEDDLGHGRPLRPQCVGVVGDGEAAWLTALALKEWRPELDVTILPARASEPADSIACLSTTPSFVPFLFAWLGIDPLRFERAVRPVLKLGTRLEWGHDVIESAFADGDVVDAQGHDGHTRRYALSAQLMAAGKAPFARVGGRDIPLLRDTRFGFQLDTKRLLAFLAERAREVGVIVTRAPASDIEVVDGRVARILSTDGHVHRNDLWVDCSGAVSLLFGKALGVERDSYATSLPCDSVVAGVRAAALAPYTSVTTLNAGWAWQVPLRDETRVGYVYSSRFCTPDAAIAELSARFPDIRDLRTKHFAPGRHRDFMRGNVVAIGDAYGEVEPLACASSHMTTSAIMRLIEALSSGDARRSNAQVAHQWDTLRWYLSLHYRFNRRVESPFWREVHVTTDWSGMEPTMRDFLDHGPLSARDSIRDVTRELGVGSAELDVLLLGLGVVPEVATPRTTIAEWHELMAMREALVAVALPIAETLPLLADGALWSDVVHGESWCRAFVTELNRTPTRGRSQDALAFWTRELGVPAVLGRDAQRMADDFPTSPNIDFGKFLKRVPEVVLRPRDQAQLAECLQMCARRKLPIRVRAAGHSSGGQTLADEGAIIDLRWLKRIISEAHSDDIHRIRVESGLWWLELCGHLRASGRRPVVLTDNWRSSIGGTLAVGGFGDATHHAGLQIAGVNELIVMTMDGTRHRVHAGDDLFDWSLAGRGQLGIITEAVLDTVVQSYDLNARVLSWPSLERFLDDARIIIREGRFNWLRARATWGANLPVGAAAGHLGDVVWDDFVGLGATQGARDRLDLYAKAAEPPDERWALASPGIEVILPVDAKGIAAAHEISLRIQRSTLSRALPRGSSIMVLPTRDRDRFPLAPLPTTELAMMLAIRPELALSDVPMHLPLLRGFADLALDAGGKIYLMSLEPTQANWLHTQLGADRHDRLRALKAKWDPDNLLNPGLI